uniref:(northern house mosquito) hypothetical protein n=1 Tax=Culex pipiens TaxID=7175 RepID=A0A8D8AGX7_CULPI
MILLVHYYVCGIAAPVEAHIALEATVGVLRVDVDQQVGAVRCDQVAIGALEPALAQAGRSRTVHVVVIRQMLFHHEATVGGERTSAGHTLEQTVQTDLLEHLAAVFLALRRHHVGPRLQPHRTLWSGL